MCRLVVDGGLFSARVGRRAGDLRARSVTRVGRFVVSRSEVAHSPLVWLVGAGRARDGESNVLVACPGRASASSVPNEREVELPPQTNQSLLLIIFDLRSDEITR